MVVRVLLSLVSVVLVLSASWNSIPAARFIVPTPVAPHLRLTDEIHSLPVTTPSVHAVSLVALPSGKLMAAWFGGSKECAPDVSVFLSLFDGREWSPARIVFTPDSLAGSTGHFTRKLGNPVLHVDGKGQLYLFVVSVGLGGWSAAFIDYAVSLDGGDHFDRAQRLQVSPIFNFGHLVRCPAVNLADGGFLLPAYFELAWKYPVMIRFDADGKPVSRHRIPGSAHLLQPAMSIHETDQAVVFTRDSLGRFVYFSRYAPDPQRDNSGMGSDAVAANWSRLKPIDMGNPDSSIAVLPASDGGHWLACNPKSETGRCKLVMQKLDVSTATRETISVAEAKGGEFSYPALARTADGRVHMVYTDQRTGLTHRIFEAVDE